MQKKDIYLFVRKWFHLITDHASVERLLAMLETEDLEMKFPEQTLVDTEDFKQWYQEVTNQFFDQVHDIKNIEVELDNDTAYLTILVNWRAHTWDPPDAYSNYIDSDAVQTWQIVKNEAGELKIKKYIVEALKDNRK